MKKQLLLAFVLVCSINYSQNLDSLYNRFLEVRGRNLGGIKTASASDEPIKCSFGIVNNVKRNFNNFSAKQKGVLASLLSRPVTDTSIVSPSGKFKIHFNKKGAETPTYSVNELAKIADYVYKYEIDSLKYPAPPTDGAGAYDIYIQNIGSGAYGYTSWDSLKANNTSSNCYTIINYDYSFHPTKGLDAVKVTIAHEFHHTIQVGDYAYKGDDVFYHEATSTAMEDIVYNDINDYYFYLPTYFSNPGKAMSKFDGYPFAIWNLFLRDKYGVDIIKEIWEKMPVKRAVESMNDVLSKRSSSLLKDFNEFGVWTYYTNSRAIPGQYFKEAANYPLIKMSMQTNFTNPTSVKLTSEAITNNFIQVDDGANSIVSLATNADIQSSINGNGSIQFELSLSQNQSSGYSRIYGNYFSKLTSENPSATTDTYFYNGKLVNRIINIEYAYPQPFLYSKNSTIFFPAELTALGLVDLNIYSIDMNLVFSNQLKISTGEKVVVPWNALDNNGKRLGSGVYIYVVKCGDNILKGKFVVLND